MPKFTLLFVTVLAMIDIGLCRFTGDSSLSQQLVSSQKLEPSTDRNASQIAPDKFITAGNPTGIDQYPWTVHLVIKVSRKEMSACGGSLISDRYVVTAAHCVDFNIQQNDDVSVYLGEYNIRTFPTDCVGSRCIKNVLMHPDKIIKHSGFQRRTIQNDIALLRLRGSAPKNTDHIRPIRLPSFNINDAKFEGTPLFVTGWGQTESGQQSAIKRHAQVLAVAPQTCRRYIPVTDGMLCAVGRNGQDSCFGDSGGPIMVEQGGEFQLVGLVSFGLGRCGSAMPSVYTNVFSYLDWIQNAMKN